MPPRNRREEAAPPEPPKPPAPTSIWAALFAAKDDLFKWIGFGLKGSAVVAAVGTPEGRAVIGEAAGVVQDGAQIALHLTTEMARRKGRFIALAALHALVAILISAFTVPWGPRGFWLAMVFLSMIITAIQSIRSTAAWWLEAGAVWRGTEAMKEDKVKELLKLNPLPVVFSTVQPAVEGALKMLWSDVQFEARVLVHFGVNSLFLWQPFYTNAALLIPAAFVIPGFIGLAVGYNKETKWQLWYVYLYACLADMFVTSWLAWNPWILKFLTDDVTPVLTRHDWVHLGISGFLLVLAWIGIQWAAIQDRNHKASLAGGNGKGGGSSSSSSNRSEAGVLLVPAIAGAAFLLLCVFGFKFVHHESDGLTKVVGIAPFMARHNFGQTWGTIQGTDAITESATPSNFQSTTTARGDQDVIVTEVSVPVRLGAMDPRVDLKDGDQVSITVSPETYNVYDDRSQPVTLRISGMFKNGSIATPEAFPDRMRRWRNDYPSLRLPDSGLLGRVGNGDPFFVGSAYSGTVHGSGPLRFYLNLPQLAEFQPAIVGGQSFTMTITVKRAK